MKKIICILCLFSINVFAYVCPRSVSCIDKHCQADDDVSYVFRFIEVPMKNASMRFIEANYHDTSPHILCSYANNDMSAQATLVTLNADFIPDLDDINNKWKPAGGKNYSCDYLRWVGYCTFKLDKKSETIDHH